MFALHRTPVSVDVRIFKCWPRSRRMSLPRCVITPAVPAPPPMIAPIAAPLPPPAIAPMIAPMPEAAPTFAASSFVESRTFHTTLGIDLRIVTANRTDLDQLRVQRHGAIVGEPNLIEC